MSRRFYSGKTHCVTTQRGDSFIAVPVLQSLGSTWETVSEREIDEKGTDYGFSRVGVDPLGSGLAV